MICLVIKCIYPTNISILDIYNNNFIYFIFNLVLINLFFITISFKNLNFKKIILFYLITISLKIILVYNFKSIFLSNIIIYFIFLLLNLFFSKIRQNFIHTLDFSGKTNFLLFFLKKIDLKQYFDFFDFFFCYGILAFKGFLYLLIIFLINKYGIINNSSSFLLINIILDLFFIPILTIIFNMLLKIENINEKQIINTTKFCTILQILISVFLYIFINNIVQLFNFENGIINYSIYIFKILSISMAFIPIQYIIPIYCYIKNKKSLVLYNLLKVFVFFIIILSLSKYKLNGILYSIPISIITYNVLFIFIMIVNKNKNQKKIKELKNT